MKRFTCYSRLTQFVAIAVISLAVALPAKAAPFAYIPNTGSNSVSVIDTVTNTVVTTVTTVGVFPYGVAVHPDGSTVYVAINGSNSVSVIDTATNTVVDTVTVGSSPMTVDLSDGSSISDSVTWEVLGNTEP